MCSIHIILDKQSKIGLSPVTRMLNATYHRGPDAHDYQTIQTSRQVAFLGHNRLKITDLRDVANQPMTTPDGRYWLLFNGAIYNFRQLRTKLQKKYAFTTESDTEVLLYCLIEAGEQGLAQVNGMYALAFYDSHTERLLLARDPWGMKPLFFFEDERYLIVSSEIRGILATELVEKQPELSQIAYYLRFKFAKQPGTFYQRIFELEPGVVYESLPGQKLKQTVRHKIEAIKPAANACQNVLPTLSDTLTDTVRRYLQADVPAGLLLSGGIDSTLLLALAHEVGVRHVPTFTIAYAKEDEPYATQDHRFARIAARQFDAEPHEVVVSRRVLDGFWEWLPTLDQPVGDGAAWLTWLLAQEATKHVKVVLSGAGADELFAGYNRHWAFYQYVKQYPWLKHGIPLLQQLAPLIPNRAAFRHWHKLVLQLSKQPQRTFVNFTAHLPDTIVREGDWYSQADDVFESCEQMKEAVSRPKEEFMEESLQYALRYDQSHYLRGDVLTLTDRMTMQHGLEARLPYLSTDVVQLAQGLSATFRLQRGRKWLLKEMLMKRGGDSFVRRRKEGFGMPFGYWLRTTAGKPLIELLRNRQSAVFDVLLYNKVAAILQMHLSGKRDYGSELWTLLVLTGWMEQEFGKGNRGSSIQQMPSQVVTRNLKG